MRSESSGRPTGGDGGNKDRILNAARGLFGVSGFRGTTLRAIAAQAGVDVALIAHYFGSKEALFAAAIGFPDEARLVVLEALSAPEGEQGERLARGYLWLWESAETGARMKALGRSALTNEAAAAQLSSFIDGVLSDPEVAAVVDGRRADLILAMTHLIGVAFVRYLIELPLLAEVDFEVLVAHLSPAVQLHLSAES